MSLKICIPVSQSDIDLLALQAQVLVALGGLEDKHIHIFPTPSVYVDALRLTEELKTACGSFACTSIGHDPEGGWPYAPNFHFGRMIHLLKESGNQLPFMNLEPDCTPLTPSWSEDLITEHNLSGKLFTGVIRPTAEVWRGEEGFHMVGGCAIYPPNFHDLTSLWMYPKKDQPYDVFMRWAIVGSGGVRLAHDTKLIQHLRRTENYQQDSDVILCQDCIPEKQPPGWAMKHYSVSPEAVMVHGCRDSSLAKIVLAQLGMKAPDPEIAKTEEDNIKKVHDTDLIEKVKAALTNGKMTLKALAESLAVDKKELRVALESEGSPFEVRPPILWVSLREPAQTT